MSEEKITEKTIYSKKYDDSENVFVRQNQELGDDSRISFVHNPARRCMRDLIVKKSIEFSEKYHITAKIKEDSHFLFVAFGFGKYMYFDFLKQLIPVCDDVFIVHEEGMTMVELIFCTDEMTVTGVDDASASN